MLIKMMNKAKVLLNAPGTKRLLRIASTLVKEDHLPSRGDGPLQLGMKALGIIHTIRTQSSEDNSGHYGVLRREGLVPVYSQSFVEFFFESRLRDVLNPTPRALNKELDRIDAVAGESKITFLKSHEREEFEDVVFVPKDFKMGMFCERIWSLYPNGLLISVSPDRWFNKTVFLDVFPVNDTHLTKVMRDRLSSLADLCRSSCAPQSMLFLGPAGTGKTACCQLLAKALDRSLLRVDATALSHMGLKEIEFILKFFAPGVLSIEDFDRADSTGNARMLMFLERARKLSPKTMIILSANDSTKIDYAALRGERIDWVEMFQMPTEDEVNEVLGDALTKMNVGQRFYCKGLCHANLNRVARVAHSSGDVDRVIKVMALLQELSEQSKEAEAKKSAPPDVKPA